MKLEIDVKYNIGDKVLVTKVPGNDTMKPFPAVISGYAIDKNEKRTVVWYLLGPVSDYDYIKCRGERGWTNKLQTNNWQHKRRYGVNCLQPLCDVNAATLEELTTLLKKENHTIEERNKIDALRQALINKGVLVRKCSYDKE